MPARAPRRASSRRTLYIAGGLLVAAVAFLWWRSRSSSSTSGLEPGSGLPSSNVGSSAQQPSGGASNTPGNLPADLVSQPDPLQQQVQQTDTTSPESPTAIAPTQQVQSSQTPVPSAVGAPVYYAPSPYTPVVPPSGPYASAFAPIMPATFQPSTPTGTGGGYVAPSQFLLGNLGLQPSTPAVDIGNVTTHGRTPY